MRRLALMLLPLVLIAGGGVYGFARPMPDAGAGPARVSVPEAVEFRGTSDVTFKLPADNTWYTCGQLTVPAGTWRLSARAMVYSARLDTGTVSAFEMLSTSSSSVSDPDLMVGGRAGGNLFRAIWTLPVEKVVVLVAPATYYLAIQESEGNDWDKLQCLGERSTTLIRAERLA